MAVDSEFELEELFVSSFLSIFLLFFKKLKNWRVKNEKLKTLFCELFNSSLDYSAFKSSKNNS
jgi:hypothetical protein